MPASPYTVNCSILLTELPLLQRPEAARAAGFDAVEFWWPFAEATPSDREVDEFVSAISDAGVQLTGLNFAAGDMPGGERGILSHPGRSADFRASVDIAVEIAKRLGTKAFNALYGNRRDDAGVDEQDAAAVENLIYASEATREIDAVVLIEPVSGSPLYPLKLAADAVAVIDRVAAQSDGTANNLRLLADVYHMSVNGDDVPAALEGHADLIGHVQIADAPGRGEPGTGSLPLAGYLEQLAGYGYRGYVGLEYKASREDPFDWLPLEHRSVHVRADR
ncbi:hydroxypyruvate isomerase family protein [Mycolicibacterium smegmatis]|uniref:Hydroxypyruvate isomerase, putative n=1 Tax=Mycolicibacterium smegmatis (strain MKD8) TaxID=1214915 RepID=A0A2U9PWZ2_MYCSE|nr:TIM barrel protein [Mycolicibacterium smegmatis]AWT56306.1 hydroxypyruvate isomerase, putative [Mycolicibacterium smegmatis MKD8]